MRVHVLPLGSQLTWVCAPNILKTYFSILGVLLLKNCCKNTWPCRWFCSQCSALWSRCLLLPGPEAPQLVVWLAGCHQAVRTHQGVLRWRPGLHWWWPGWLLLVDGVAAVGALAGIPRSLRCLLGPLPPCSACRPPWALDQQTHGPLIRAMWGMPCRSPKGWRMPPALAPTLVGGSKQQRGAGTPWAWLGVWARRCRAACKAGEAWATFRL